MNDKRVIRAWSFYDWANSAYSLVITTAIFPSYYTAIVPPSVQVGSITIDRTPLASFAIAFSFLLIAFLSPLLSSIADYRGNKKTFMRFFCYLGAAACMALFFFKKSSDGTVNVWFGISCAVIASLGYCGSIVFYNAFLPEIASKDRQDRVSARGFAMGYIGSILLMIACFDLILLNDEFLWMASDLPARISFLLVGLWWIIFAQIPFRVLKEEPRHTQTNGRSVFKKGYAELALVWKQLSALPVLRRYLLSFFFYNMGVQTVMYMATYFAKDELQMETTGLLSIVLIIQGVAIGGAWLFARVSEWKGNKLALLLLVLIWIVICIAAYFTATVTQFYLLAVVVGMVMGGIQSLSRSTFSRLLPPTEDTASFFSFYDVCDKIGIVSGTLSFGLVAQWMGGMRNSTLWLACYFVIGLLLLLRIPARKFFVGGKSE